MGIYYMKTLRFILGRAFLSLSFAVLAGSASAQIIYNGSFELGTDPGSSINIYAVDSGTIAGWTVQSGSVDYIGTRWASGDGGRCLDLSGWGAGTIWQDVSGFTVGANYQLSFLMAGNPEAGPTVKSLQAGVGSTSDVFYFDGTGFTTTSMGWGLRTLDFTATSPVMTLTFTSLQSQWSGPALDGVSLSAIPEPSVLTFMALAIGALVVTREKKSPKTLR
jgi:choice-of-anchor C domain-containing protein